MSVTEPLSPAGASLPMDDVVGRVALRKAGWRLIPLLALGYGVAYMDRVNISFASLQMNRDLHFSASVAMGLAKDFTGVYQPGLLMLVIPTLVGAATIVMMRFQSRASSQ
jgi:hypothetical protein